MLKIATRGHGSLFRNKTSGPYGRISGAHTPEGADRAREGAGADLERQAEHVREPLEGRPGAEAPERSGQGSAEGLQGPATAAATAPPPAKVQKDQVRSPHKTLKWVMAIRTKRRLQN